MGLELSVSDLGAGRTVIRAAGEILHAEAAQFEEKVSAALDSAPAKLLINLTYITSISSAGIGVLIASLSEPEHRKSRVIIVCGKGVVQEVLSKMGLLEIVEIAETEEAALKLAPKNRAQSGGTPRV